MLDIIRTQRKLLYTFLTFVFKQSHVCLIYKSAYPQEWCRVYTTQLLTKVLRDSLFFCTAFIQLIYKRFELPSQWPDTYLTCLLSDEAG